MQSDAAQIAATLERLGEQGEDIAPEVFERFIARRPDCAALFGMTAPGHPPVGCGSMVFEIVCVLRDLAQGEAYVTGYLEDMTAGHRVFGVQHAQDYADFLDTLQAVVAARLGTHWPPAERDAWQRQTRVLQGRILSLVQAFGGHDRSDGPQRPRAAR